MKIFQSIAVSLLFAHSAFAEQNIQFQGTTLYPIHQKTKQSIKAQLPVKSVRLLNVKLSENAWQKLNQDAADAPKKSLLSAQSTLPSQVQLGMNEVPVLDQGPYGTCVTFAITAAIDAALNKGDYLSQVCQLQLGQYLEQNGYVMSGWNGSSGSSVLNQMDMFGFVTKNDEQTLGCGGLTTYPTDGNIPTTHISPEDYYQMSHNIKGNTNRIQWASLLDLDQIISQESNKNQTLDTVKKALNDGDRLTFGVLLFLPDYGVMGAAGQHNVANDTWLLTPMIRMAVKARGVFGGHEMIITGYDDNAISVDPIGLKHHGLLTLRNSWSDQIGDAGNFYMTYDYFKLLTTSVERIRH